MRCTRTDELFAFKKLFHSLFDLKLTDIGAVLSRLPGVYRMGMRKEIGCHIPICGFCRKKGSCHVLHVKPVHSPVLSLLPNVPSVLMKCDLIRMYQVICLT